MREPRNYEAPLCAEVDGDAWFPENGANGSSVNIARVVCQRCTHRLECAEWGINYEKFGIWGGLTARQRVLIRRQRNIKLPERRWEGCA
jgi:hypothetical protein